MTTFRGREATLPAGPVPIQAELVHTDLQSGIRAVKTGGGRLELRYGLAPLYQDDPELHSLVLHAARMGSSAFTEAVPQLPQRSAVLDVNLDRPPRDDGMGGTEADPLPAGSDEGVVKVAPAENTTGLVVLNTHIYLCEVKTDRTISFWPPLKDAQADNKRVRFPSKSVTGGKVRYSPGAAIASVVQDNGFILQVVTLVAA